MRSFFNIFAFTLALASALGITAYAATAAANAPEKKHAPDQIAAADEKLKTEIDSYWKKFSGRADIAIYTPFSDEIIGKRQTERFPQQSVSKMWVALTILEQEAAGKLSLDKRIRVSRDDVVVFSQPLKNYLDGRDSFDMSLRELLAHSVNASDNLANNVLLRVAGGPQAINQMLERRKIQSIRFGPGEVLLQSAIAGLEWQPEYRKGNAFKAKRSGIPMEKRKAALDAYVETPLDGAAPGTIALVLKRFSERDANDPGAKLLKLMAGTYTGRSRLRSGLAPGWRLAHKTGTGQVLGQIATAVNDVGVMTAPDGCVYPVAVMVAETRAGTQATNALMQNVARAVTRHHERVHPKAEKKASEALPKSKPVAKPAKK
ncbi:MAG: serine hydrolase [Sphingomonadaceae bacterium]|jgi:beta-lactamase class A|uniref:serine hydrolase n=1 Tax=Sphingorhabdus sp. TaxID=1902408 RepID=UPI002FD9F595|nr:serine hydrolase [Sphingomonadaceae bacterium]